MSKKQYKKLIIQAGYYPTPEMIEAVQQQHMEMLGLEMIHAVFRKLAPKPKQAAKPDQAPKAQQPAKPEPDAAKPAA